MNKTLKSLLQHLEKQKGAADRFIENNGLRVFILRNDGCMRNNTATIERARLWKNQGEYWMEIERWNIETHQVEKKLIAIGPKNHLETGQIDIKLNPRLEIIAEDSFEGLPREKKLFQLELSNKLSQTLENRYQENRPIEAGGLERDESKEPYIYFERENVIKTLWKQGENLEDEPNYKTFMEEEREGTLAQIHYQMEESKKGEFNIIRRSYDKLSQEIHKESKPIKNSDNQVRFMPLDTILTLLEEQMYWSHWLKRTKPTPLDAVELSRYIHKSGDYQEIYHYLRKNQNRAWEINTQRATKQNLLAMLLTAATVPSLNEKIGKKLIRHQINSSIFHVFYAGGHLNQVILKHGWILGWFDPFTNE